MPIPLILCLVISVKTSQAKPYTYQFPPATLAGEREIVVGPQLQYDVTMEVHHGYDVQPEFSSSGVVPGESIAYSKGFVRWSVTDGNLGDKPCRILSYKGTTKDTFKLVNSRRTYLAEAATVYWVGSDGKLLQQSNTQRDPNGERIATTVFSTDHLDVTITKNQASSTFTLYPSIDMKLLDNQFTPMLAGDKFLLNRKEFLVFDPFTRKFTKYRAWASGTFHGTVLATMFDGVHVDIQQVENNGPDERRVAYVSKEGDLVLVKRPNGDTLALNMVPHSKDPMFQRTNGTVLRVKGQN